MPLNQKEIYEAARVRAIANGVLKRFKNNFGSYSTTNLPFTLLPTKFTRKCYEKSLALQKIINELYSNIVMDPSFLLEVFQNLSGNDPFIQKLYDIYQRMLKCERKQDYQLGLIRTDYLLNTGVNKTELRQVEVNCIAVSFGGISPKISLTHQHILQENKELSNNTGTPPSNNSLTVLADGLISSWEHYGNPKAIMIFVVEQFTSNEFDQRYLEWEIINKEPKIRIKRYTFLELHKNTHIDPNNGILTIWEDEVGVVYYRTGYEPSDYQTNEAWEIRAIIENSMAIKCPSIQFQLAGTKKVQERLADPSVRLRFLDQNKSLALATTFAQFYPVDGENAKQNIDYAIDHYQDLVLKPIREGGGHNLYGEDIKTFLIKYKQFRYGTDSEKRDALQSQSSSSLPLDLPFVLMEKIKPPSHLNYIVRAGDLPTTERDYEPLQVVSELGIFGTVLCSSKEGCISSSVGGYLLRSKPADANETGIVAGFGALDSLLLE